MDDIRVLYTSLLVLAKYPRKKEKSAFFSPQVTHSRLGYRPNTAGREASTRILCSLPRKRLPRGYKPQCISREMQIEHKSTARNNAFVADRGARAEEWVVGLCRL